MQAPYLSMWGGAARLPWTGRRAVLRWPCGGAAFTRALVAGRGGQWRPRRRRGHVRELTARAAGAPAGPRCAAAGARARESPAPAGAIASPSARTMRAAARGRASQRSIDAPALRAPGGRFSCRAGSPARGGRAGYRPCRRSRLEGAPASVLTGRNSLIRGAGSRPGRGTISNSYYGFWALRRRGTCWSSPPTKAPSRERRDPIPLTKLPRQQLRDRLRQSRQRRISAFGRLSIMQLPCQGRVLQH